MDKEKKDKTSLVTIVSNVFKLFDTNEKTHFLILFIMGIINSCLEAMSIGVIFPLLKVLFDVKTAVTYPVLKEIYNLPFIRHIDIRFIVFVAFLFMCVYVFKCAYNVFYSYMSARFLRRVQTKYSMKLYEYYLSRPYEFFFTHNTNVLHRRILTLVSTLINGVVNNTITLIVQILTATLYVVMVIVSGTTYIILAAVVMFVVFIGLYSYIKNRVKDIAFESNNLTRQYYRLVLEYLQGIKALLILNRFDNTTKIVKEKSDRVNALVVKRGFVLNIPNAILEAGIVIILLFILVMSYITTGDIQGVMASIGLCGAAAYKLRGSFSSILTTMAAIRDNSAYYDEIYGDMVEAVNMKPVDNHRVITPIEFNDKITFNHVSYKYGTAEISVFEDVNIDIKKGEVVGIVGPSGAGKSTFADILLGLLIPTDGGVYVDKTPLKDNVEEWRAIVGYVPQTIFMMDTSILENVAFGLTGDEIDRDRVMKSLEIAQLKDFVDSLPNKEMTLIGDRGVKLSGGQRQRIGIARALYTNPQVLIFDEATSSLDNKTEEQFVETVNAISDDYTIIMIAHRLETLKYCNRILAVRDKKIVEDKETIKRDIVKNK